MTQHHPTAEEFREFNYIMNSMFKGVILADDLPKTKPNTIELTPTMLSNGDPIFDLTKAKTYIEVIAPKLDTLKSSQVIKWYNEKENTESLQLGIDTLIKSYVKHSDYSGKGGEISKILLRYKILAELAPIFSDYALFKQLIEESASVQMLKAELVSITSLVSLLPQQIESANRGIQTLKVMNPNLSPCFSYDNEQVELINQVKGLIDDIKPFDKTFPRRMLIQRIGKSLLDNYGENNPTAILNICASVDDSISLVNITRAMTHLDKSM